MGGSGSPAVGILSRAPEAGRSKTRLAATIGDAAAADMARAMLLDTTAALDVDGAWRTALFVEPPAAVDAMGRLTGLADVRPQATGGLGRRMQTAGEALLNSGHAPVVLVGSDIPGLGAEHVRSAIEALSEADVVLGPADDGGYYLIGFWSLPVAMFNDETVPWGSNQVLRISERIAREQGWRSARIAVLRDLDTSSDLATLRKQFASQPATALRARHTAAVLATLEVASRPAAEG
jgi:rSAM/selenodomain-associated transferase 1